MQQSLSNNNSSQIKRGFWRRQFQERATKKQKNFDWIFGVILPAICFLFDPFIFKGGFSDDAILGEYKPFAYVLSYVSIAALFAFLTLGKKLKYINAFLAGLFFIGGLISSIIGVILLPFSLLGLFLVIGLLGFTPLFTAFVYLRNAVRAFQTASPFFSTKKLWNAFALATIFSFAFPAALNIKLESLFSAIENGDAEIVRANARTIRVISPIIDPNRLVKQYRYSKLDDPDEKQIAVDQLYRSISGKTLSQQIAFYEKF